jgi:predicted MPP superfamily phosphohydrolase
MKRRIFRRRFLPILLIFAILAVAVGWEIYRSSHELTCSHYEIRSGKLTREVRIVQLSDLHNASFGEENDALLELVADQQPDLIFCTGDFLTGNKPETAPALTLVQKLCAIAPVYFSLGNHEILYADAYGADVMDLLYHISKCISSVFAWESAG